MTASVKGTLEQENRTPLRKMRGLDLGKSRLYFSKNGTTLAAPPEKIYGCPLDIVWLYKELQ
jgi:hypothetical protein